MPVYAEGPEGVGGAKGGSKPGGAGVGSGTSGPREVRSPGIAKGAEGVVVAGVPNWDAGGSMARAGWACWLPVSGNRGSELR